jgi:hypothetical protein
MIKRLQVLKQGDFVQRIPHLNMTAIFAEIIVWSREIIKL